MAEFVEMWVVTIKWAVLLVLLLFIYSAHSLHSGPTVFFESSFYEDPSALLEFHDSAAYARVILFASGHVLDTQSSEAIVHQSQLLNVEHSASTVHLSSSIVFNSPAASHFPLRSEQDPENRICQFVVQTEEGLDITRRRVLEGEIGAHLDHYIPHSAYLIAVTGIGHANIYN